GLNRTLANNIVHFRNKNGAFDRRKTLLDVDRLGPKAYEQAAGFLRIMNGKDPLDASAVHPESYPVVQAIVENSATAVNDLIGNSDLLRKLNAADFVCNTFGLPTVTDIISELDKPGRDPRPEFKTATFKEGVESLSDLKAGMILEGVVSNVANFGAFVDVGVHQDGLVHISAMTDKFITDPREVVKTGDIVTVKVMEVDVARKRVSFTMRLNDSKDKAMPAAKKQPSSRPSAKANTGHNTDGKKPQRASTNQAMGNAFADALAKAKKN
ncbi:MAG: hypothetical protein ACI88A_004549, partial [Paraglaciecola sp.]